MQYITHTTMFATALFIVAQRGNNSFINRTVYKTTPSTAYHIANNNNKKKTLLNNNRSRTIVTINNLNKIY